MLTFINYANIGYEHTIKKSTNIDRPIIQKIYS